MANDCDGKIKQATAQAKKSWQPPVAHCAKVAEVTRNGILGGTDGISCNS